MSSPSRTSPHRPDGPSTSNSTSSPLEAQSAKLISLSTTSRILSTLPHFTRTHLLANLNSDSTPFGQLSAHQANLQSADRRSLRCGEAARIQNIEPPSISSLLHSTSKWSPPLLLCEPVDFHPAFSKHGFTTASSRSFSWTYKLSASPLSLKNRLIFSHNLLYSWPSTPRSLQSTLHCSEGSKSSLSPIKCTSGQKVLLHAFLTRNGFSPKLHHLLFSIGQAIYHAQNLHLAPLAQVTELQSLPKLIEPRRAAAGGKSFLRTTPIVELNGVFLRRTAYC